MLCWATVAALGRGSLASTSSQPPSGFQSEDDGNIFVKNHLAPASGLGSPCFHDDRRCRERSRCRSRNRERGRGWKWSWSSTRADIGTSIEAVNTHIFQLRIQMKMYKN